MFVLEFLDTYPSCSIGLFIFVLMPNEHCVNMIIKGEEKKGI